MQAYPVAKIDLAALQHNLQRVKQLAPQSKVMSVIKANAYGHCMIQVAKALTDSDALAVARLSEALRLREAGIQQPIILLEGVNSEYDFQIAAENNLSIVFHYASQIEFINKIQLSKPLEFCWLMIETGMHRLGIKNEDIEQSLQALTQSPNILGQVGLMSHFANADLVDDPRNQQQLDELLVCAENYPSLPMSMANSGAILSFPDSHSDWVRPGLMLYGVSPFDGQSAIDLDLKPVMQLVSSLTSIQQLDAGEQLGYGGDWIAPKTTQVGIVSIGYGDGYSRQLSNVGTVSINEKTVPVLGRVSMDMIAVDLTALDNVVIGNEVILWGCDLLPVEDVARQAKTIPYELLCQVSERVKREYQRG